MARPRRPVRYMLGRLGNPGSWLPSCWHRPGRLPGGGDAEAGWCVCSHLQLFRASGCSPPGSSVHGDSPGKNARVGCHALLQGIFLIQGSNPSLLHCRRILYQLSYWGSPRSRVNLAKRGEQIFQTEQVQGPCGKERPGVSEGLVGRWGCLD